jgi:DHA2 family multidrug resistance protein
MALWGVGVTMGPILGPALGGYLTEDYNWRWVFYINVPIGILAFIGLLLHLPETEKRQSRFDFFGFLTLSIAIGFLQILLDRGQLKDWFSSIEIITETIISGLGFYLFMVHSLTCKKPFLNPELFKDRNFIISTILMFVIGIALFATLALIPTMLQNQLNFPVITIGLLTAPRGVGTLLAMLFVGRLVGHIDSRFLIITGLLIVAFSLLQMTTYSLQTDTGAIVIPGIIQGFGIGLAYIPLGAVAFTNLGSSLRDEGTSFFNLMRNLGASIGISVVETLLSRNTQRIHATLGANITPYNIEANAAYSAGHFNIHTQTGLKLLNKMVTDQSMMIGYIDDYKFIMIVTLAVIPLVFLLRKPKDIPKNNSPGIE